MIDPERDKKFADWLLDLSSNEPPAEDIIAINFGLFETSEGFRMYVTGSRKYDPIDDDWACEQDYYPTRRYFEEVFDIKLDWETVHRQSVELVSSFLHSHVANGSFLTPLLAVTVGFDSGNLERIK